MTSHLPRHRRRRIAAALSLALLASTATGASAGETEAKALLKAMSDYLAAQKSMTLDYDNSFEVVTKGKQKLQIAASGKLALSRPDKLRATRVGGFANVEMIFDGKTFTLYGKEANAYFQTPMEGTVDQAIDTLREKYNRALPGADLLVANVYDNLMEGVTEVQDLGAGVVAGKMCDHIALRSPGLDLQVWIAQGTEPYPCRYVITTTDVEMAPQYTVTVTNFAAGGGLPAADFTFVPPAGAMKLEPGDLAKLSDMPANFSIGQ